MSGRTTTKRKLQKAHAEAAKRDERIADLERAHRRLAHLYDISKLLTRSCGVERTLPDVIAVIAQTLPLRSAIFLAQRDGSPQMITWLAEGAEGENTRRLLDAEAHARAAYGYLVGGDVDVEREANTPLALPRLAATEPAENAAGKQSFVMLPLVIDRGPIFGALQLEGTETLDEPDLMFVNAAVNQLAIGLDRDATERAVRASEAKLAGIIAVASDAIISFDEAQRIVMYNEGAEKTFGWSRDEVLGKPLDILIPERFRTIHSQHIRSFAAASEAARSVGQRHLGIFGLRKTGEEFPVEAAISKLKLGRAWLFTVSLQDVTEQKRIEHEQKFLAELGAALLSTLDYQERLTRLAQLTARDLGDLCIVDIIDDDGEARWQEVATSDPTKTGLADALKRFPVDSGRPHLSSAILRSKQPQLIADVSAETLRAVAQNEEHLRLLEAVAPTSMMGVPLIVHDRLMGALSVVACLPERRYGATDLHLLEEVGRHAALALENARLYRTAERAVQMRDDVLGIVAHDLRNPLGAILMQAALLRRPAAEPERRSQRPAEAIERAATCMTRLIQDLLDVARLAAGQLSVEQVRVSTRDVVSEAVETQKALTASAGLELRAEVAPSVPDVWADRDRLLQAFANLIGNAIKFTEHGGRIAVGALPRDGEVLFWVADTGAGIAIADIPHAFDRFWQARKSGRSGAGLGLSIVKGIVEAHGGRIWVESTPGRGSTFFFTIPTAPPAEGGRGEPAPQRG
jgi:PAS domain S-box-containing protein